MESSDERATARLIAERTLALAEQQQNPPADRTGSPGRLLGLAMLGLGLVGAAAVGMYLSPRAPAIPAQGSAVNPAATAGRGAALLAARGAFALLNCNAWPSASVYVDGKRLPGSTPLHNVPLSAGPHTVRLVSKDGTLEKEMQMTLSAGETRTMAVVLDK